MERIDSRDRHPAGSARAEHYDLAQVTAERLRSIGATTPPRLGQFDPIPSRYSWLVKCFEDGVWWFEPWVSRAEAQARVEQLRAIKDNPSLGILQVCDEYEDHPMYHQTGGRTW